jgi:hypothetical protein
MNHNIDRKYISVKNFFKICLALLAGFSCVFLPQIIYACTTCYAGEIKSSQAEGMKLAIIALLGITGSVLSGFVAFFLYLRKKAKMSDLSDYVITENGEIVSLIEKKEIHKQHTS